MAADRSPAIGVLEFGRAILHDEARALDALADQLGAPFEKAVDLICACRGKLIVSGLGSGPMGWAVGGLSFLFIMFVVALELLMCVIQAYVFALLTALYLHDAVHLH